MKNLKKCGKCNLPGRHLSNDNTLVCARHFVEDEGSECLLAMLKGEISNHGKIVSSKDIQLAIKKYRPEIFRQLKIFF